MQKIYKGHKIFLRAGYPSIYAPEHNKADKNGLVYIHIIVAEERLKRGLKDGEVVHHKDENKLNYKRNNLMIFDNKSSHSTYHACIRYNRDMILAQVNGVWHCEMAGIDNKRVCPVCGKLKKSRDGTVCMACYQKRHSANIPSKSQLVKDKQELRSFCAVGRKYNVSDNAVRKWFRKYNLPL
jgi:hypothetical protein